MTAEGKQKRLLLAAALLLLAGGGTGGFFLGKAQTLKQQQQIIDVQDCTTIYGEITQISGDAITVDGCRSTTSTAVAHSFSQCPTIPPSHGEVLLSLRPHSSRATPSLSLTPARYWNPIRHSSAMW